MGVGRILIGAATGGLSEVGRAAVPLIDQPLDDAANAIEGATGLGMPGNIDIKNLGKTTRDTNIGSYTVPPEVLAAYTAIGNTHYTPQTVSAPGFSVGDIAKQYAIVPEQVTPTLQSQFLTNQDAARQQQVAAQQFGEANRLRSIVGGAITPADLDNQMLLRQAQALQVSGANTARGTADQRLAAQRDAAGNVVSLGSNNLSVLAAQRAQQQADARGQLSQMLGTTQQQDAYFQGASFNIANADALRAANAANVNQQAGTTAAITNAGARVSGTAVDQNAGATITGANNVAGERGYVGETGRMVTAGAGANAVEGVGISADAAHVEAMRRAREEQIRRQQYKLEYEKAKRAAELAKLSAGVGAAGQVLGIVSGGA